MSNSAKFPAIWAACVLFVGDPGAIAETATCRATCRSIYQDPIDWIVPGYGHVTSFFTTFDGKSGLPLFDTNSARFSGELRPRMGDSQTYEGDYVNLNSDGLVAYGFGTLKLPVNVSDTDLNTIPDIFQLDKGGAVEFTGTIQSDYPTVGKYTTIGTLKKAAGESFFANAASARDAAGFSQSYTGRLSISYFTGEVNYRRGPPGVTNQLEVTVTGRVADLAPTTYTGSTWFAVVDVNTITIPQFTAGRTDGATIQVFPMTLTRHGKKYIGDFEISDGNLATYWPDYTGWVLEISDKNDRDANGIPDLSDQFDDAAPVIISQPRSQTIFVDWSLSLYVDATAKPPPTFQWQFNGEDVVGATNSSLGFVRVQPSNSGKYRVIVSNRAGSTISSEATVTVTWPPAQLRFENNRNGALLIFWPKILTNYVLEVTADLGGSFWSPVAAIPRELFVDYYLPAMMTQRSGFYRLRDTNR